jgi:hypothetical protein
MVTVTNTGTAAANGVDVWCYLSEDNTPADTTQMKVSLAPGETKDVPFTWYGYSAGDETLTCKPLLPDSLETIADSVVASAGATSPVVSWEYADEDEDAPILIYIAAALGFVGLAVIVARQSKTDEKSYDAVEELAPSTNGPAESTADADAQ